MPDRNDIFDSFRVFSKIMDEHRQRYLERKQKRERTLNSDMTNKPSELKEELLKVFGKDGKLCKPEEINIIGFDFGDGDVAAYIVRRSNSKQLRRMNLFSDPDQQNAAQMESELDHRANVIGVGVSTYKYADGEERERVRVAWKKIGERTVSGEEYFCNFKCAPGSEGFGSAYRAQKGSFRNAAFSEEAEKGPDARTFTNGELMGYAFAEELENILNFNKNDTLRDQWNERLPTLIYVGCPAGTTDSHNPWHGKEEEYAKFLMRALMDYARRNPNSRLGEYLGDIGSREPEPILLKVVPESSAAIAYELSDGGRLIKIGMKKCVLLIDLGSSTTDFSYVENERLDEKLNYSCMLGGGMFDDALLALAMQKIREEYKDRLPEPLAFQESETQLKLKLRQAKEIFYSDKEDEARPVFKAQLQPEPASDQQKKKVSKVEVFLALSEDSNDFQPLRELETSEIVPLPQELRDLELAPAGEEVEEELVSLREAYRRLFERYKEKLEAAGKSKLDEIIVTGGVSHVDWVCDLIQEVFGLAPRQSDAPHASVARGLALAARIEYQKWVVIDELMEKMKNLMGDFITALLWAQCIKLADLEYDLMKSTLHDWAYSDASESTIELWLDELLEAAKQSTEVAKRKKAAKECLLAIWSMFNKDLWRRAAEYREKYNYAWYAGYEAPKKNMSFKTRSAYGSIKKARDELDQIFDGVDEALSDALNRELQNAFKETFGASNGNFSFNFDGEAFVQALDKFDVPPMRPREPLDFFYDEFAWYMKMKNWFSVLVNGEEESRSNFLAVKRSQNNRKKLYNCFIEMDKRKIISPLIIEYRGLMKNRTARELGDQSAEEFLNIIIQDALSVELERYSKYLTDFFYMR